MPIVGTGTLAERASPYVLAVELARGKLNDIRNQLSDWLHMGLRSTPELDKALAEAHHSFVRCVTSDRSTRTSATMPPKRVFSRPPAPAIS